jgi:predicted SnoaL-like aldol condensation-catalyzing enzyme
MADRKQQVVALLKSIETGDPAPISYIDPGKYIQHNLAIADGLVGLRAMLGSLPAGSAKVRTVRVFEDGDFVFTHTDYDFFGPKIGFDVFRFENGRIVEHWDNLQETPPGPSPSGHAMTDGPTEATDLGKTEVNKALLRAYMDDVIAGRKEAFPGYFNSGRYIQHNPWVADDLPGLFAGLTALAREGKAVAYTKVHRVLGEGNFVLVVAAGTFGGAPTSYYDLYRVDNGKLAEHWDALETIPARAEQKNDNGKF